MLKRIRDLEDDTVIADGPKFDLAKVTETALSVLRALQKRVIACFPDETAHTVAFSSDDKECPLDEQGYLMIDWVFSDCQVTKYDVTPYSCSVYLGPFAIDLYLLGIDCLHGPMISCTTDDDLPWNELDPTPVMSLMMKRALIDPFDEAHFNFLRRTLDGFRSQGVEWHVLEEEGGQAMAFTVRFPHAAFGKGFGPLRICRYLRDIREDGEEGP